MAPILKDAENPAEPSSSATAAAASTPKAVGDGSTRTQPVALEIPVTVNGARAIEGSDKREPFSETTKTVLVFNHGAVIRIATPLAAGQLVFLTNEKSKKEVVCQVVKSKSGGGPASGYVELQFTEPALGFWGMRFPAAPAPSAAASTSPAATTPAPPRPTTPVAPAPSAASQAPTVAPAPPAASAATPGAPVASIPPPTPKAVPPTPPVTPKPVAPAATTRTPAPVSFAPPPAPLPPVAPLPPTEGKQAAGVPEIHDYSKEIAAIFAVPPVTSVQMPPPSNSATPAPSASSQPTTEELKQQAARLQAQLGTLNFTESPAARPASSPAASSAKSPAAPKVESTPANTAQKPLELTRQDVKPAAKSLPKVVPPASKHISYDIDQVEEVKVPDWLAPLSRNAESTPDTPAATKSVEQSRVPGWLAPLSHTAEPIPMPPATFTAVPPEPASSSAPPAEPPSSYSLPAGEPVTGPEHEAFGGAMLDESLESVPEASTAGSSKKGLFLGLAAAALLIAGGGVWYMRQSHSGSSNGSPAKPVEAPASNQTAAVSNLLGAKPESAPLSAGSTPSSPALSSVSAQPLKNSPANAASGSSAPAATAKNAAPPPRNEPPAEQLKKPSLGRVHLAAPVVNRGANPSQVGDADSSLAASVSAPGAESLSALSSGNNKEPAAPLPVGGDVKAARLVKSVPPIYPQMARTQRISGNVTIDAVVDVDGNVSTMKILSGPAILHRAALDAVKQWRYEPAILDGKATASHLTVIVQFRLQ